MTKEQMKAEIDRLNEEFNLEVTYSDNADGKELKAKLAEAKELASSDERTETSEKAEESTPETTPETTPVEAEPKAPVEEKVVEKPLAKGRKKSWPEGFTPSGDKIADTKAILDAAPKVSFLVPRSEGEDPRVTETVQINGYKYEIMKGHMVTIPKPVADLLARKYQVQMEVAMRASAYSTPQKQEALS